jgi:hypothetical protein
LLLAVVCIDTHYSLFAVLMTKVFILLRLPNVSPAPRRGVTLLLKGSLEPCHLPLPASREVAGAGPWEGWRELKGSLFCSSEHLLLLLKENGVYVANRDSEVVMWTGVTGITPTTTCRQ